MNPRLALIAASSLGLLGSSPDALAQEARFHLSLGWTVPEIEPEEEDRFVGRTIIVTLGKGGKVREEVSRSHGRRKRGGRVSEGALGGDLDGRARWKVLNERTLLRLVTERSHTFSVRLQTDGTRSCAVTLEWRLKPGFTVYEGWARRRAIPIRYRQPTVEQASCTVL